MINLIWGTTFGILIGYLVSAGYGAAAAGLAFWLLWIALVD
jgi:hypothetical protein